MTRSHAGTLFRSVTAKDHPAHCRPYNTAMFQKKILSFVCAVAIVGIGACFLPPEHVPPPPLPPYLAQVSTVAIQVQDVSGKDLIDENAMSQAVASNVNQLWKEYSVRAIPFRPSGGSDATLQVTIVRKSLSNSRVNKGKQPWELELTTSAKLTSRDGKLLWQEENQDLHSVVWLNNGLPSDGWNSRVMMKETAYSLALSVGGNIVHNTPSHYSLESP